MEEEVQKIWTLSKADRIQNADYAIGIELTNLYCLLKEDPSSIPENFEDLLLALIVINKGQISIKNAHLIGLCCIFYYKKQNPPNYWKLMPALTEEVKKLRRPSIYILGLLSKRLCDGFKSQLPTPIQYLLKCNDETLFPLICQCFRRIIKGTGTFLIQLIPEIFGFIFAGSSSTNELIRIESVKSLPTLLEHAHISIKKLLPIIGQLLPYTSKEMRYSVSKSLAKLIYIGAKVDTNLDGKRSSENIADTMIRESSKENDETGDKSKENTESSNLNPFKYGFKIILQFSQNDKNVETLALTMHILLRFYQPIEIVKRLRTFTNFIICLPSLKLSLQSLLFLSNGIISSVASVVGSTIGNSICYLIIDSFKNSEKNDRSRTNSTDQIKALIALSSLIHFDASTKTFATAAKQFYPLLSSDQKHIQKVCIAFFAKLGQKEMNLGRIFIDTFCSFLATVDDTRINDIDGFSKATASLIVSIEKVSIFEKSIEKVKKVITTFLHENHFANCKMPMAYLLLASLAKRRKCYDMIPFVFNFTQSYLKTLPTRKIDKYMKKTIKYISLYFLQIILKPPNHSEKLTLTIRYFISIILPNVGILSKSGQYIFLKLAKSWYESNSINNEKIADFLVRQIVSLYQASFEKETRQSLISSQSSSSSDLLNASNSEKFRACRFLRSSSSLASIDADLSTVFSADLDRFLFNFETPSNRHVSNINVRSLTEIVEANSMNLKRDGELVSDDDFFLINLQFWISKCSQKVLNDVIPPLFEFNKLDVTKIVSRLKILTVFLKSNRDLELSKAHFEKFIGLEKVTRIDNSQTSSKPQKQRFTQIQFALSQTVSQWFIKNSTFSDVNCSDLNILMDDKNVLFSSFLISFLSKFLCDEIQVQSLLFLMRNIQANDNPALIYALDRLLSSFNLISEFSDQVINFLAFLSYSNSLVSKPSTIKSFAKSVLNVGSKINNRAQIVRIISNLLHFPLNSNYSKLNGLQIASKLVTAASQNEGESFIDTLVINSLFEYQREFTFSLEKPLPILMSAFLSEKVIVPTIDDVPLLFMMLQQSSKTPENETLISDIVLRVFQSDCNVKKWTNFAKRIVIIGCVPPAERKGDIRIVPTSSVLICAIKITVLLVSKIRETMELRCVDDIVSIAFTAIHMENRQIDPHCYSILSSVIACFEDVRNQEGSLLDVYFSQFHPTFGHAFDEGKRELKSVASYIISYVKYIENNRNGLIDEVYSVLVSGLKKMKFDNDSIAVFCRVSSLVNSDDSELNDLFMKAASSFIKDVLLQKRKFDELKDELPNFISKFQSLQKVANSKNEIVPNRIILALLVSELSTNCNSVNLNAITNSIEILNDINTIDFVIKTIANSNLLQEEADEEERIQLAMKETENRQTALFNSSNSFIKKDDQNELKKRKLNESDDFIGTNNFDIVDEDEFVDNDIAQSSFWVFPVKKQSSVNRFLVKITNSKTVIDELFESILSLSLSSPICFVSLCNILRMNSEVINNRKFATLISFSVLNKDVKNGDNCLALFKFMFDYLSLDVVDSIVPIIVSNSKISNQSRFEILRYAFLKLNGFEFLSILDVVTFLQQIEVLLPDGLNFIGSLLVSPRTALTGVYILQSGLMTHIATSTVSPVGMRILPRILHFFNTALNIVKKICDREDYLSFSFLVSRVALVALAQVEGVKEKAAVVRPACLLIKSIEKEVIEKVFTSGRLKKKAIAAVTPQRQAETIQLLTFANVSNRKSNNGEWQTLEVE